MVEKVNDPGASGAAGLALALQLLVMELAHMKAIDARRYIGELKEASKNLDDPDRAEPSDAVRLLAAMASQLEQHLPETKK